ncbi:hypothetical protein ACIPPS_25010 [Streptomyces sp. NPDC090127]|uniref:hypothetical protein n=1 Tax=Streptomyces sp. NPDC090127 TaxID=3365953 RepID=UPI0037F288A1
MRRPPTRAAGPQRRGAATQAVPPERAAATRPPERGTVPAPVVPQRRGAATQAVPPERAAATRAPQRGAAAVPVVRLARRRAAVLAGVLLAVALAAAGCGGRPTTHHKPGTSHQEATGGSGTLLAATDEAGHRLREVPADGAPAVRVAARPDTQGGWNIHLTVERFRFTPESVGGAAIPGRGHARLLVDGKETGRAYGPWQHVPPGARAVTVRLHADDHTVWAVAGQPVEATVPLSTTATTPPAPTPPAPTADGAPPPTPTANAPTSPAPTAAPGRTVEITVTGTSVQPPPSRIELKKGERLTLRVTADRADTLHVHGYDRELPLVPGEPGTLTFTADRTGLFEVETHGSGLLLTQLVVR